MGYKRVKTEHAGAKNGGGAWMTRAEAKESQAQAPQWNDAQVTAALRVVEAHDELASYLDQQVPSDDGREDRWATENARDAIREEQW